MLEALLDWKKTCAFALCNEESQATLRSNTKALTKEVRKNGWTDKWFKSNQIKDYEPEGVPVAWHMFEAYMTKRRAVVAGQGQGTVYKDWMFELLAHAECPEKACWNLVRTRFLSALKEIVNTEITVVTFPDKHTDRGSYVSYDEPVSEEGHACKGESLPDLGSVEPYNDVDLERLVSADSVQYAFKGLDDRQRTLLFFRLCGITLNRIPFDNDVACRLLRTRRFQGLYEVEREVRASLLEVAKSLLKTGTTKDSDIEPFEIMLLAKMLLMALTPKIREWAIAENLPQPSF
jgi:hypothetical protein